ncbi:choice-of-anchor L domain-containing protein [Lacinutrix chionoecetis]
MIKKISILLMLLTVITANAQNISVDSQTYTPQQLIEDILIDSDCITSVQVTNAGGGDFGGTDQSYGYFDATGTTFPFQNGIVLSTGRLSNVPGPNNSLSDDDAPNWNGDPDLEIALQENNTTNATIIEFEFTTIANQISFRYIFASEEYQDGDSSTCQYSDLFGFLIKPSTAQQYQNIALVPGTQTPVKVTTVHPEIPGACQAENETYFDTFNNTNAPINFNGQTTVLTATANTIPNQTYQVKLVIADEQNYRYDSAVFLEAGSFNLATDLGPDRLLATNNPVCDNETIELVATQAGSPTYTWFQDGIEQTAETTSIYEVTTPGTYNVEVTYSNGCISYGEVVIEYAPLPVTANSTITNCDIDQDGLSVFDLYSSNQAITAQNTNLEVVDFYLSQQDAAQQINEIATPENFVNTTPMQTVYVVLRNELTLCTAISEIALNVSTNTLILNDFDACDDAIVDGFTTFNLNDIRTQIEPQVPMNASITFYETLNDAYSETNSISDNFTNTIQDSQTIYVKVDTASNQCYAISDITLNVLFSPQLLPDESFLYCLNSFPETITLVGGVTNAIPNNFYYQWLFNGTDTGITTPFFNANEIGTYTVIVTDPNGCFNLRELSLIPSNEPSIENLDFTELTANNTATITVSGEGDYEFAIDNEVGFYQNENSFSNLEPGFHTIYVRDKNGCGSASIEFSILGFPQYFTPNGDTFNEVWKPMGTSKDFNANLELLIFNRYGKLLSQTTSLKGWDGTLKGYNLPSDDYWYIINHPNGKQYRGHFALVR